MSRAGLVSSLVPIGHSGRGAASPTAGSDRFSRRPVFAVGMVAQGQIETHSWKQSATGGKAEIFARNSGPDRACFGQAAGALCTRIAGPRSRRSALMTPGHALSFQRTSNTIRLDHCQPPCTLYHQVSTILTASPATMQSSPFPQRGVRNRPGHPPGGCLFIPGHASPPQPIHLPTRCLGPYPTPNGLPASLS